MNIYKHLYTGI